MDIRQHIRDSLLQEQTGVTAADAEALAVEQCVVRLSAGEWQHVQEAFNAMEEALKALYMIPDRPTWAQQSLSVREGVARDEAALAVQMGLSSTAMRRLHAAMRRAWHVEALDADGLGI